MRQKKVENKVGIFTQLPPFQLNQPYSYYHMGIKPQIPLFFRGIQKALEDYLSTLKGDWFRYAAQNYVIWTSLSPVELANGVRAQKGLENLVMLITPFQPSWVGGYMPQEFWNWLQKQRVPGYVYTPNR
jgi:hypothetical protein